MADPTDRNDPTYSSNPDYVWSGGRWQNANNRTTTDADRANAGAAKNITAEGIGTPGGFGQVFTGFADWASGKPFANAPGHATGGALGSSVPNLQAWQDLARANANRAPAANPYQSAVADQSRAAQMALIQQMRAQAAGPSLAAMQGQRAMGQMGQQAIGQGGRGAMVGAAGAGAGLAADTGQARLSELMRMRAGMGGAASQLRSGDLRSAEQQQSAGLQAQNTADTSARAYSSLGSDAAHMKSRTDLETYKLIEKLKSSAAGANEEAITAYLKTLGTMAGMGG